MKKTLSRLGLVLRFAGIVLSTVATIAHISPPGDPSDAGAIYDEHIESYNRQVKAIADANPHLPAPSLGKTRLQAHKEDTMFGVVVGLVMAVTGLMVWFFNRSKREATSQTAFGD